MLGSMLVVILLSDICTLASFNFGVALAAIILLGISFLLVPAALWPSVPKLSTNSYWSLFNYFLDTKHSV